jgi:primosomal protein N''
LSDRQIERISQILAAARIRTEYLDDWDLTLTCDHVVRRAQHNDHDLYSPRVVDCTDCGTRRGVVSAQRLGSASDQNGPVERQRLNAELSAVRAKLDRQRKAITATEERIAELTQVLLRAAVRQPRHART